MEDFSLEAGITVSVWPTIWALRMRISMSAMGSLMLIRFSLPARLDHARHLAAQREIAQLVAAEAELAIHAARPARQGAAVAQPHRRRVARQLLQLEARFLARLVRGARVLEDVEQRRSLVLELRHGLAALLIA